MSSPNDLTPRVVALETDDTSLQGRVTVLEQAQGNLTDLEARVAKLETDYAALDKRVTALETANTTVAPPAPVAAPAVDGLAPVHNFQ